jgi:hypothetical protein
MLEKSKVVEVGAALVVAAADGWKVVMREGAGLMKRDHNGI